MNAEQLLQHFERISEAPAAIPRLRRFILDLAVRGKLVEQDASDEPAEAELIEARRRLELAAQTTKRLRWKRSGRIETSAIAQEIPAGWTPARVNDTGLYINGLAFKPSDWKQTGLPIIRIQNLTDPAKEFNYAQGRYPEEVIVQNGDLLVSWSATLEAFKWERGQGVLNQHIFRVVADAKLTSRDFLLLLLRNAIREMAESEHAHGLVMTHINRGPFLDHVVLIPPLAEQHRIVAKVEELMSLCDQLEAAKTAREQCRDSLVAACLQGLNQPADEEETFREHASFTFTNLPRITTRVAHIKQLRQTVLNLAVRGKLVEGTKGEEVSVGDYRVLQNGYAFKSSWFSKSGIRLLRNANIGHDEIRWNDVVHIPDERFLEFERFKLNESDIVLTLDRPFIATGTKVARISAHDLPSLLLQRVGRFIETSSGLDDDYLFLWINSPHFNEQIDPGRSNGVPHISSKQVQAAKIIVPKLAEQKRIVAKVEELMAICDQLEAQLTATEKDSRRFLEAVLNEALSPALAKAA